MLKRFLIFSGEVIKKMTAIKTKHDSASMRTSWRTFDFRFTTASCYVKSAWV